MKNVLSLIFTCTALTALNAAAANLDSPNILIFLVDDMGLMDTSVPFVVDSAGKPSPQPLNKRYHTPNMEKLAARGLRFSHFYANSVCSPTRVSLLNGQFSARHKVTQWINPKKKNQGPENWKWTGLTAQDTTLPKIFKEAGYTTIHAGKAHLGPFTHPGADPTNLHFDHNIAGTPNGAPGSYYGKKNYGKGSKQVPHLDAYHGTDTFLTEAITLETNKKLTALAKTDKPFFLHRSHYAVHGPFDTDERFAEKYRKAGLPAPETAFATLIEGMDKSLGDVIAHLEHLGQAENTLIVFLGDNGSDAPIGNRKTPHLTQSSAPYKGKKATHYEGGMLAPLIIAWAKPSPDSAIQKKFPVKPGIVSKKFVTICDLFPTILNIANLTAPAEHPTDGHTLVPFLREHDAPHPQKFLMHFPHRHRTSNFTAYRENNWKLVKHHSQQSKDAPLTYELFDLAQDPYEQNNLAESQPEQRILVEKQMQTALDEAQAQYVSTPLKPYK